MSCLFSDMKSYGRSFTHTFVFQALFLNQVQTFIYTMNINVVYVIIV